LDWLNLETYQKNRERPLRKILQEFKQSFPLLLEQVQVLREDDLGKVFQADWTDCKPATVGEIVSWRYWHYRGHGKFIENWINRLKKDPDNISYG
jgi:hypothetical protein